jgi:UDP-N-acetylmuramyl pentapeptide phosphotransferase/UDP-N-acetylglucosamine-1-phosphate transferase
VTLYESYGLVVAFAIGATFVLTFPVRWIATRVGAVDQPGEHRMHAHPTPVVGGAAMLLAF